ncbi:hypothetical protein DFJ73DRAFT_835028 [Zopfochytrium polystomum]|nr:hypothetical protein DFJ73DRAFT_835028 [Zopfochytrium polystomum]
MAMEMGGSGQIAVGFLTGRSDFRPLPSQSRRDENAAEENAIVERRVEPPSEQTKSAAVTGNVYERLSSKSPGKRRDGMQQSEQGGSILRDSFIRPVSSKRVVPIQSHLVAGSASLRPRVPQDIADLWMQKVESSRAPKNQASYPHAASANLTTKTPERKVVKKPADRFVQFGTSQEYRSPKFEGEGEGAAQKTVHAAPLHPVEPRSSTHAIPMNMNATSPRVFYPAAMAKPSIQVSTGYAHSDLVFSLQDVAGGQWTDLAFRSATNAEAGRNITGRAGGGGGRREGAGGLGAVMHRREHERWRHRMLNHPTLSSLETAASAGNPEVFLPPRPIVSNITNIRTRI